MSLAVNCLPLQAFYNSYLVCNLQMAKCILILYNYLENQWDGNQIHYLLLSGPVILSETKQEKIKKKLSI